MKEEELNELGKLRRKYEVHIRDLAKTIGCSPTLLMKYEIGFPIKNKKYLEKINKILENSKDMYYLNINNKMVQNINDFDIVRIKQIILLLIDKKEYTLKLYKKLEIANVLAEKYTGKSITGVIDYEKILDEIINQLCNNNILKRVIKYNKNNSVTDIIYKIKHNNYDCLDDKQLYIIDKINDYFKNYSLKDIMCFNMIKCQSILN